MRRTIKLLALLALATACPLLAQRLTTEATGTLPPSRWSWSAPQKTGAALYASAVVMDCATTQVALSSPRNHETNPLLGPHPTPLRLWSMCAAATGSTLLLAHLVGRGSRGWVLGIGWAVEMLMAAQNLSVVLHQR